MPASTIYRPVIRSFKPPFAANAAAWARSGGHAVLWETPSRGLLILPKPDPKDLHDLALWSLMDLGKDKWDEPKSGMFRGLATAKVPRDCAEIVKNRTLRDAVHEGPTRRMRLDCLECGACCQDNEVVLEDVDPARFLEAGRPELLKKPYTRRRKDGRVVLTLKKDKRCHHLGRDNKCAVYTMRPNACREFPAGSECCLWARFEEKGTVDGDRWD